MDNGNTGILCSVIDLIDIAGRLKPSTVVIAGGHRIEDLRLVESARDHGIVDRIVLIGKKELISHAVEMAGIEIARRDIVAAQSDEDTASKTVKLIRSGKVDIVLKGGISTPIINRHMLTLETRSTVGLATVFEASPIAQGRPMLMTDAGVTTVCNFGRMVDLINNSVEVARVVMGIKRPRVAVLSANEKQIPSLPSTWMGKMLSQRKWPNATVYGPLSFDLAVDPESVAVKGLPDIPNARSVAGRADIVVCPGIDSANILYKTLTAMTKFGQASMAGITVGFPVPYIILSRADPIETSLLSIALCSIYQQRISLKTSGRKTPPAPKAGKLHKVFVFNTGSTSIKMALYQNDRPVHEKEIPHNGAPLTTEEALHSQITDVTGLILKTLKKWKSPKLDGIAARGGFLPRPSGKLSSGTYVVADKHKGKIRKDNLIVSSIMQKPEMQHASNLGIPVAAALAEQLQVPAYCVDPVVVDEFIPEAEVSGYASISRRSTAHALSIRAAAQKAAQMMKRSIEDTKFVVAHLGGGITIAAVAQGKIIDNNIALLGEGPFTPQRTGGLPIDGLIDLCYSGKFTREELLVELTKKGGLLSYLGEYRLELLEKKLGNGDKQTAAAVDAMVYQIAKEIGAQCVAAGCDIEAVILTGGLVKSPYIRNSLRRRITRLAPIMIFEESLEMPALAAGVTDVLSRRTKPRLYQSTKKKHV